ncbi:tRNA glutamyl-Q(34) synthetase GluQRS [Phreatobacter stygius]|uniref:tRNA glutamyl-Q(34) synthetase GluQRS n=1 Tax=Phreatobacter stygius TaxID=1940610 RepID=A0A4D7B2K7_9HYPH|nr:tRNA glutamyl-Q(34) synthetase GluQRS [Phreatobacter stygius]QCI64828.1 tRNA glutamyl-Q(34) synthetase GluQRS [Phreatobacter stygius]
MALVHPPISRSDPAVLRFAPSPNGALHLGHALSALENAAMATRLGGRLLLRIEDIDRTRCRPEFERAMLADLAWLGIGFEMPPRRQSEHLDTYRQALGQLDALGLIYASFESRGELKALVAEREAATGRSWPIDPDGVPLYAGTGAAMTAAERNEGVASGRPFALRLRMAEAISRLGRPLTWTEVDETGARLRSVAADPACWGDVVLARKDVPTSYHLSVVVDDALQDVSHIVRGQDLFEATAVHRLLQELLGLAEPLYRHHRLILGADGRKLSKSEAATGLAALRAGGASPADIGRLVGIDPRTDI